MAKLNLTLYYVYMANYRTHLIGGVTVSTAAALALTTKGAIQADTAVVCAAVGTIGGLAPDLDLGHSKPTRYAKKIFTIAAMAAWPLFYNGEPSEMIYLIAGSALAVWLLFEMLDRFTVHRGMIHSIPAMLASGMTVGILATHGFGVTKTTSWVLAGFMILGFFTHLLLDEIYSVDFMGRRIKKSFGTAICLGDAKAHGATFVAWFAFLTLFIPQLLL